MPWTIPDNLLTATLRYLRRPPVSRDRVCAVLPLGGYTPYSGVRASHRGCFPSLPDDNSGTLRDRKSPAGLSWPVQLPLVVPFGAARRAVRLTYCVPICQDTGCMILGYKDRRTQRFAGGAFIPACQSFERQAARKLAILNAAPSLETLKMLPSNRQEMLGGRRTGQYSIRINRQWRICFTWPTGVAGPSDVEIVDYH